MSTVLRQIKQTLRAVLCGALACTVLGPIPVAAQDVTPVSAYDRLVSLALTRLDEGRPVAAQWMLRRAFQHAKTEAQREALRGAFRRIANANPLRVNFWFNVAPSSNINGGTNLEFFSLGDIDLIFGPESRALSGTEVAGQIDLSYRLAGGPSYATSLNLFLYGRTYRLSSESRKAAPMVSGSDYAYVMGDLGLRHQWLLQDGLGPTAVSLNLGRVEYGKEPYYRYHKVSASQDFLLPRGQLSIGASFEDQVAESTARTDARVIETRAAVAWQTAQGGVWRGTLLSRRTLSFLTTETFDELQASANFTPTWRILGAVPTVTLGLGAKDYDDFILSFDGRRDRSASLGVSLMLDSISVMGFSPVLSLTGTRTRSNIARYDMTEVKANFGLQSQF